MATEFGAMNDDDILQAIMDEMDGPVEAEEAKPQGQTKVQSETEDVSDVNPTDDEESEDEAEDTQDEEETEESEEEDWFPNDLSELAEAMQVDLDALKAIKVKTKVDGVESDVPLGEVIKNYQINKSLTERSEQLAHNRKAFEQQATEFQAARDQQIQQWQMWNGVLEQRLKDQVGAIDWQQLREDDPAEYAAKRQEFTERIAEIENLKAQVAQQAQAHAYERAQQWQQQFEQTLQENIKALPELVEDWKGKPDKMREEMTNLKTYLGSFFTPEEVSQVYDARHIAIARKAMLYDELVKKGGAKMPALKQKPKFIKPAARNSAASVAAKQSKRSINRAVQTQTTDDWAKVIEDLI